VAWDSPSDDGGRDASRQGTLGDDLERSVAYAEQLMISINRARSRLRTFRLVQVALFFVGATMAVTLALSVSLSPAGSAGSELQPFTIYLPIMAGIVGVAGGLTFFVGPLRRQYESDLMTTIEITRAVREVLPAVAKRENWTEIRHGTMRARLSRFPISDRSGI